MTATRITPSPFLSFICACRTDKPSLLVLEPTPILLEIVNRNDEIGTTGPRGHGCKSQSSACSTDSNKPHKSFWWPQALIRRQRRDPQGRRQRRRRAAQNHGDTITSRCPPNRNLRLLSLRNCTRSPICIFHARHPQGAKSGQGSWTRSTG